MGEGSNIYRDIADELGLPDTQYTTEEEYAMVASYIEKNNIFPVIKTIYNTTFVEYFKIATPRKIIRRISIGRRNELSRIRRKKQWSFQTDEHIFHPLSIISDRGYTDAPLEDKFYFLRPTASAGFGGHMNTDIEGYGTMIYRMEINGEAEGGFLEY